MGARILIFFMGSVMPVLWVFGIIAFIAFSIAWKFGKVKIKFNKSKSEENDANLMRGIDAIGLKHHGIGSLDVDDYDEYGDDF